MNKIFKLLFISILLSFTIIILKVLKNKYESFDSNFIDKIYVINLLSDKKRLNVIDNSLNKLNLNYIRFDAINGKYITPDDNKKYFKKKNKLSKSQKGCALSHIKLWEHIHYNNDDVILILEDDSIIPNNFTKNLNTYIKELPNDWDMILLGGNSIYGKKHSEHFIYLDKKYKKNGNYGLFAYLIKKQTVPKLLESCKNLGKTIDHNLNKKFYVDNKVFFCNPMLISHNYNFFSNIMNRVRTNDELKNNKIIIIK